MGLSSFLKKIFSSGSEVEGEDVEKFNFSQIRDFLDRKKEHLSEKESKVIESINERAKQLEENSIDKLNWLESVDVDSRNIEKRAKVIVKENLSHYISHFRNLLNKISSFNPEGLKSSVSYMDYVVKDFDNKSFRNYQKAAFLFEKKLKELSSEVVSLSKFINKIWTDNRWISDQLEAISAIYSSLREIKDLEDELKTSKENIKNYEKQIIKKKDEKTEIESKIGSIEKSDSYKKNLEKEQLLEKKNFELDSMIKELKDSIDFKKMGHVFHKDEDKIKLVKDYRENFVSKFKEDFGKELRLLLNNSGHSGLEPKINNIISKNQKIEEIKDSIEDLGLEGLISKKESKINEIKEIENSKNEELRNKERILSRIQELKNGISKNVKILGGEVCFEEQSF